MFLFSKAVRSAARGKGVSLNILYPLRCVPVQWTPGGENLLAASWCSCSFGSILPIRQPENFILAISLIYAGFEP
ncbi:hypothetical protein L21_0101 [Methanoculleus chikugoensis]|uniref:Uncharacterized protein n=1 Tax=Methanoculleus chikugoensis TaxID=118126 RepID=A0A1M4MH85_9EURY|nr:hypothetical protein L21_0101 [Methanoculleus chikugoensis]